MDCQECNCPRDWHSHSDGHCYGCNKKCESEVVTPTPPFEIAQDLDCHLLEKYGQST